MIEKMAYSSSTNTMRTVRQNGAGVAFGNSSEDPQRYKVTLMRTVWSSIFAQGIPQRAHSDKSSWDRASETLHV